MKTKAIILTSIRLIAAVILLQTLYFKFTAHPESVVLFSKLGVEPWGRISVGVIELITIILLLLPSTAIFGALIAIGIMAGAIGAHLLVIGITTNDDGGLLFVLAIIVLLCCCVYVYCNKSILLQLYNTILKNKTIANKNS